MKTEKDDCAKEELSMQYRIIGDTMPAVEVLFDAPGESMYTQSGGMAWMTEGISMDSNMKGGLGKSIGRMFSGESLFMATYKAERAGSMVAFASTVAGEVLPIDVGASGGMICQKGAFLCAQGTVNLNVTLTKKFSAGLLAGKDLSCRISVEREWCFWKLTATRWRKIWCRGKFSRLTRAMWLPLRGASAMR